MNSLIDIKKREDVFLLVDSFYVKVRKNDLLGPIFNDSIKNWEEHLNHLTDFWETNLFFVKKYKGDPMAKHIEVDQQFDNSINEMHFGIWLNLWFETVDELFAGDRAQQAKNRARQMGTFIYLKIFEARK